MLTMKTIDTPLGLAHLVAHEEHLAGVYLPAQAPPIATTGTARVLELAAAQLAEYFAGDRRTFELPLAPQGTAFQRRVWDALLRIPYGETWSYGRLAREIGSPSASRAVGAANGKNPLSIIVPCHRVIGATGALTGYAGGVAAKQWLLAHERGPSCRVERAC
jgi:methylated-DNA-[protein]-cysteine S-methyltransferase